MILTRGKIWGNTACIFEKNNVEIHRINAKKGGYCSVHRHDHKYNLFFVERGELEVCVYRENSNNKIEDITILKDGESTYVEPGVLHKFSANKDTIAYEIYWVEIGEDIIRESVGGIVTEED